MSRGGVADGVKPLRVLRRRQQTAPHAPPTTHSYVDGDHLHGLRLWPTQSLLEARITATYRAPVEPWIGQDQD
jgi:hypothetical protein